MGSISGWFNVKDLGAQGDAVFLPDAAISGSTLTAPTTAPFKCRIGQTVLFPGAKSAGLTSEPAGSNPVTLWSPRGAVLIDAATSRITFASPGTISDTSPSGLSNFGIGETLYVLDPAGVNTGVYTILSRSSSSMTVGKLLITTIQSIQSTTQATLAASADNAITMNSVWSDATPLVGADDTTALQGAIDAVPPGGGVVFLPPGIYLTTGLTIESAAIRLLGSGGISIAGSAGIGSEQSVLQCATILVSATSSPVVTLTAANKAIDLPAQYASVEDLGIVGFCQQGTTWLSSQDGIKADTRGSFVSRVFIARVGGNGFNLTDCVAGSFQTCQANRCVGHGFLLAPVQTASAAVTDTLFQGCISVANAGAGIYFDMGSWGNLWLGGLFESNRLFGAVFDQSAGGTSITAFNRIVGAWDENNRGGSVHFLTSGSVLSNSVDYVRYSSGSPVWDYGYGGNVVGGSDLSGSVVRQPSIGTRKLRGGAYTSADYDHVATRLKDDSADGLHSAARFISTIGLSNTDGEIPSAASVGGGFNLPNGRTLQSKNAAGTDDYPLIYADAADIVSLGSGSAATTKQTKGFALYQGTLSAKIFLGSGSPQSVVTASPGSLYLNTSGGAGTTLYVKESGTGNTGWVGK